MLLRLFRGNIRRKLVLLVLAASLPALAVILHSGMQASREDVAAARRSLAALVDGMALEQSRLTASTRSLLTALAALPAFQERDAAACSATLGLALQANPTYATLHFLDPQGGLLASGVNIDPVHLGDRKHVRDAVASRGFSVGEYTLGRTVSGPILPFGQAVLDGAGEVAGVLVGAIRLEYFRTLFLERGFPEGTVVELADWRGLRLYRHPGQDQARPGEPIQPGLFEALRDHENLTFARLEIDGVERQAATRALRLPGGAEPYLRLAAWAPTETIAAPAIRHMYASLAASAGAALLAAAIAWFLGAKIMARSMEALARTARRLEQGDTSARVDIPRLDGEMQILAESLNSMAEAVRQRETDRGLALEDLRASEERQRAIADNVPALIAEIDDSERYVFVNKYYKTCYGVDPDRLIGRTVREVIGEANYAGVKGHIRRVLAGEGVSVPVELSFLHGLRQCFAHYIPARDPEGRVSSYYLMIHDVTEFKRMEQELRRAARAAQAASEAKSAFLANMSHEIRTPINGLMGMLQLLEGTPLDLEQQGYLECAAKSGGRLTRLLSDILDLSRIEAGNLTLRPVPFRLADLRDSLLELFGPAALDKGLDFAVTLHPGTPDTVVGDETRLLQVLFNLVGNALKFTTRGQVLVEVSPLLPGASGGEDRLLFTVHDTGIGIPEAMIQMVLEPFSQADGSFSRRHQGAGLGLSIVRKLTGLMGGELAIDSTADQGSDFHLSLRFARPTPANGRPRG